jgi:hypothetical protein
MEKETIFCDGCGAELKPSQYARRIQDDGTALNANDVLVCRNYPACSKAEKEVG